MSPIGIELLPEFLVEADEHLQEMESLLLALIADPENTALLDEIFRPVHSIKGGAQYINLERVSLLTHRLEDLLDLIRRGKHQSSRATIELLMEARDCLVTLLDELNETQTELTSVDDLVARITDEIGDDLPGTPERSAANSVASVDSDISSLKNADNIVHISSDEESDSHLYEEENDQELFAIYLDNMRQNLEQLSGIILSLTNSEDKAGQLAKATTHVKKLQATANYMDYADLSYLYNDWLQKITTVQHTLALGRTPDIRFMTDYLSVIASKFPQLPQFQIQSNPKADSFMVDMLSDFLDESSSHLKEIGNLLAKLAPETDNTDILAELMQQFHTLGASAEFIDLRAIPQLTQGIENSLASFQSDTRPCTSDFIRLLKESYHCLNVLMEELSSSAAETTSIDKLLVRLAEAASSPSTTDSKQAKSNTHANHSKPELPAQFSDQEENDQELYSIYIDNMRQGISTLLENIVSLSESDNKADGFAACADSIRKLQSSANYMDYTDLSNLYLSWLNDIETAQEKLAQGKSVDDSFMQDYINDIISRVPQLEMSIESDEQQLIVVYIKKLSDKIAALREQMSGLMTESDSAALIDRCAESIHDLQMHARQMSYSELRVLYEQWLEENIKAVQEALNRGASLPADFMKSPMVKSASNHNIKSKTAEASESKLAFKKLSAALDRLDHQTQTTEQQTLHDVLGSMLTSRETPAITNSVASESHSNKLHESISTAPAASNKNTQKTNVPDTEQSLEKTSAKKSTASESLTKKNIRVDAEKIDTLINQVGELVVDRSYFYQLFNEMHLLQQHLKHELGLGQKDLKLVRAFSYKLSEAIASLGRTSNNLQEGVMKVRMLPISQLFNRYPRLVHDLTRLTNKKVDLIVRGEETELDKMVVEELSDPLIHIIRNAIDHGLEDPANRLKVNKPETGTLILEAYQEGNYIIIEVSDDGRGLDPEYIKRKALERGVVTADEVARMSSQEIIRLITIAGFSTADKITNTSGRGVGMDVVKQNIEKLNGVLEIESTLGKGTKIQLKIPLTLAIIPAHTVRVRDSVYTIPLANVEETLRIDPDDTSLIEGMEIIILRGKAMPIVRLSKLFNLKISDEIESKLFVIVIDTGSQLIGLVVDELLGQKEVVIKPLTDYLQDNTGFSGATITGDGGVSLILDVKQIERMAVNRQILRQHALAHGRAADARISRAAFH